MSGSVVIVGAGIIGIACAHYLNASGFKVTLIDKSTVAGACSHGNCGHILPSHIMPLNSPEAIKMGLQSFFDRESPFKIRFQFDTAFLRWMLHFTLGCRQEKVLKGASHLKAMLESSMAEFRWLLDNSKISCEWQRNGLYYLFKRPKKLEKFAAIDALLTERFGIEAKRFDGKELSDREPGLDAELAGGFFYEHDAMVQPYMLAMGWVDRLTADGVEIIENCDVNSFEKVGDQVVAIHTQCARIQTDAVVLATGAYSAELAKKIDSYVPVLPGKGYAVTIPKPSVCPESSIVLPEQNVAITPFVDSLRIGSIMEFVGFDSSIPDYRIQQLKRCAAPYVNRISIGSSASSWCGLRSMSWDSLPIVGRIPQWENVFVATGHCMMGVMLAPATGKLLAELMTGGKTHISAEPYSLERFNLN